MTPSKTTPKDFFLHLGATVVLYASVIALINLAFSITNYLLPDSLSNYFYAGSIAWPISMLVILVPILYVLEWFIIKGQKIDLSKKDIWIRKWRIYLTLFLTGGTVVGDLITLINTYLNGEISARFVYKVLIVLFVCSAVFKYYFFTLNENMYWSKMAKRMIPWFGIVITLAVVIGGFVIVGSPAKQRSLRFDNQRINDLSNIQMQIVDYWQQKGRLPQSLNEMGDSITGKMIIVDPLNKSDYVYKVMVAKPVIVSNVVTNPSFELCATFAFSSEQNIGGRMSYPISNGYIDENWTHEAGYKCFERTIDSDKRPTSLKIPTAI